MFKRGGFTEIIICVDKNNGMLFNNRRQSRDIEVIKDIIANIGNKKLHISPFSLPLFNDFKHQVAADIDFLQNADCGDICFAENVCLCEYIDKITGITVYCWNRVYPADFFCDIDFSAFELLNECEFKGNSHSVITKKIFAKGDKSDG